MNKADLQIQWQHQQKKCAGLAAKINKSFSPEDIHQFRIRYKKLKSFFVLISFANNGNKKLKIRQRVKKIYELSGRLRDDYLFLQKIKLLSGSDTGNLKDYIATLKNEISTLKAEWNSIKMTKLFKKEITTHPLLFFPRKISKTLFRLYLDKNARIIYSLAKQKVLPDDKLHLLRKLIKERIYNITLWMKRYGTRAIPPEDHSHIKPLRQLAEELGNYNDLAAFHLQMKKLRGSLNDDNARSGIRQIMEKLKQEKRMINSKIAGAINEKLLLLLC